MAAKRPASESAEVTPTEVGTGEVTPAAVPADPTPAAPDSSTTATVAEPVVAEPAAAAVVPAATPANQVVYVEAPKPFIAKGNRGFGILIALLSTVIFAIVYAIALYVDELIVNASQTSFDFVTTLDFYAPVLMFAVGFIVLVLIVNRAGWAAHVIGSILVGLVVFFGGTGLILLLHINTIPSNRVSDAFTAALFSSTLVLAAIVGREVALWMGFSIAARGRRVKARNVEARVLYDQEVAAKRAEYEQANARNATAATVAETGPVEPVAAEPVTVQPAAAE
jgi:hypothetical protein